MGRKSRAVRGSSGSFLPLSDRSGPAFDSDLSFRRRHPQRLTSTCVWRSGWALRDCPASEVVERLRWPKRIGFILAAACGLLLFCAKAEEYYYNVFFRTKLILFALVAIHAMVFRGNVYGNPAELDRASRMPARAKIAASLSLLLWLSLLGAGRAIGYVPGRPGLHFSMLRSGSVSRRLVRDPARRIADSLIEELHLVGGSANVFHQAAPSFDGLGLIDQTKLLGIAHPRPFIDLWIFNGH